MMGRAGDTNNDINLVRYDMKQGSSSQSQVGELIDQQHC